MHHCSRSETHDLRSTPRGLKCIVCRSFPACLPEMSVRWRRQRRQQRLVSQFCLPDHWAFFKTHIADGRVDETQTRRGVKGEWAGPYAPHHAACVQSLPIQFPLHTPRHSEGHGCLWICLCLWIRNTCGASLLGTNQTKSIIIHPSFTPYTASASEGCVSIGLLPWRNSPFFFTRREVNSSLPELLLNLKSYIGNVRSLNFFFFF